MLLGRVPPRGRVDDAVERVLVLEHLPHLGHAVGPELLLEELAPLVRGRGRGRGRVRAGVGLRVAHLVAALRRARLRLHVAEAVGERLARLLEVRVRVR